jgi:hypothetical protein
MFSAGFLRASIEEQPAGNTRVDNRSSLRMSCSLRRNQDEYVTEKPPLRAALTDKCPASQKNYMLTMKIRVDEVFEIFLFT